MINRAAQPFASLTLVVWTRVSNRTIGNLLGNGKTYRHRHITVFHLHLKNIFVMILPTASGETIGLETLVSLRAKSHRAL